MSIEKRVLRNGLTVYLEIVPSELTNVYVGINAGSFHSTIPELAHVTEHVVGCAAKVYGKRGCLESANTNAVTGGEKTFYFFTDLLPKYFCAGMKNLAEVLRHIDCSVLEQEKDAVRHELKPAAHPLARIKPRVMRTLFPETSKHRVYDIETRLASVDAIKPEDVKAFWNKHYVARNSFVYIGGKIPYTLEEGLAFFEEIPDSGNAPEKMVWEPNPSLKDIIVMKEKVRDDPLGVVSLEYAAPGFPASCSWKEEKAISILTIWLAANYGPLYARMRDEKRLCYSLQVEYDSIFPATSILSALIKTDPDKVRAVEDAWLSCLKTVATEGVPEDTLSTLKERTQIAIMKNKQMPDINRLLNEIDYGQTTDTILATIESLTPDDIRTAARVFVEQPYVMAVSLPRN